MIECTIERMTESSAGIRCYTVAGWRTVEVRFLLWNTILCWKGGEHEQQNDHRGGAGTAERS